MCQGPVFACKPLGFAHQQCVKVPASCVKVLFSHVISLVFDQRCVKVPASCVKVLFSPVSRLVLHTNSVLRFWLRVLRYCFRM